MKRKHFSEEQIVTALKRVDSGESAAVVSREMGINQQTIYNWKNKYGGMEISDLSERRACRATASPLATVRYKSRSNDNKELVQRMAERGKQSPRYGHRRLHSLLLKESHRANHKKTARLYCKVLQLQLRRKKRMNKFRSQDKPFHCHPMLPNEVWAMDFVSDQLMNGRRIRSLTMIDTFSRYCHGIELDTSITGNGVVRVMDRACACLIEF